MSDDEYEPMAHQTMEDDDEADDDTMGSDDLLTIEQVIKKPSAKKKKATPAKKKAPPAKLPPPKKSRGKGFNKNETFSLLELCERFLPIGKREWDAVVSRYNSRFPDCPRDDRSLKSRLDRLAATKKPSGDADIPDEVLKALQIVEDIEAKAGGTNTVDAGELKGDDSDDDVDDEPAVAADPRVAAAPRQAAAPRSSSKRPPTFSARPNISDMVSLMTMSMMNRMQKDLEKANEPAPAQPAPAPAPASDSHVVGEVLNQMVQLQNKMLETLNNLNEKLDREKDK